MTENIRNERLNIGGMTCVSCQTRIARALRDTRGVKSANVSYADGRADVTYDMGIIKPNEIRAVIERLDYDVLPERSAANENGSRSNRFIGLVIIIAALYLLISRLSLTSSLPLAETGMGYGMLFLIGLLTSVHCIAMCGGINLSQCIPQTGGGLLRASALYNSGRVISYTLMGFAVGAIGSVITLDGAFKGIMQIIAGVFMVLMGVNMLGVFPGLRKLTPRMPSFIARGVNAKKRKSDSPLFVGLMNGLMPCGPLQAMQIYALSTGSPVKGAVSMLLFSLGTVPLMFGLGALSSLLTKKFTRKVMTVGAVFVTVLGMTMFSQGAALSGLSADGVINGFVSAGTGGVAISVTNNEVIDGVQLVNSTLKSGGYPKITVQQGIPVKWTIDAPQGSINGCNRSVYIPEYGIEHTFTQGENSIEFMPEKAGSFPYSCWMGMIRGSITVVESTTSEDKVSAPEEQPSGRIAENAFTPELKPSVSADTLSVAELKTEDNDGYVYDYQSVKITLTDNGYSPDAVIVQSGLDTEWIIEYSGTNGESAALRVPLYAVEIPIDEDENPIGFYPEEDFQFGNGNDTAFGLMKVADDISAFDADAIKAEAAAFEPIIYPADYYEQSLSCH
ncbi:MAG: sulfite exporter TauE/SafE family protein [Clostridiales bacterium]|jgi:sulfite exporter TauE/SafE/copper chaperone CopZ/plastocyanin domain-containing protein|nr:sulfite exporter TauE/SafE family protein [Clostridiales bacterium]